MLGAKGWGALRPGAMIAERQPLMRAGLRAVLESAGADVVGECDDIDRLMALLRMTRPRLVLVDLSLPGDVLDLIHILTFDRDDLDVIALAEADAGGEVAAVRAGAAGVVYRDTVCAQLPHAVGAVLAGETAIPRRLLPALLAELRVPAPRSEPTELDGLRLTEREREVLERLADGASTREIADALFVEPVTVRTHVCALLRKLGLADREALIQWARRARVAGVPA